MYIPFGVYIGKDIEVVITEKYTMTFRRNENEQFLESALLFTADRTCIGVCHSEPCCAEMRVPPKRWKYAFNLDDTISNDDDLKKLLGSSIINFDLEKTALKVKYYDGTSYIAQIDEIFNMEDISPVCHSATDDNIAQCLQAWNMGCNEIVWEGSFIGVTINTSKHMYIFEITANSIYCRAARYATCNKGVIFNQNFRQGFEAYMIEDNRMAMEKLEYDIGLFNSDSCNWNDRSVYWSVSSISDDLIMLHGCQGDTYKWIKPNR